MTLKDEVLEKDEDTTAEEDTTVSDEDNGTIDDQTDETGTETSDDEKVYSKADLNAIISRRIAKLKNSETDTGELQKKLDDAQTQHDKDVEEAKKQGRLEAQRDVIAQKYGISAEFIPIDNEETLTKFEAELKSALKSNTRVQIIKTEKQKEYPTGIAGVRV